jgi:hypothetical protein
LKGEDKIVTEGDWPIEKDADLRCTRSGQVLDDLKGKSVFDLNASLATDFAKKRAPGLMNRPTLRKVSGQLLGLPKDELTGGMSFNGNEKPFQWNGATVRKWAYHSDHRDSFLPAVYFAQEKDKFIGPLVAYAHDRGKEVACAPGGEVERLVKGGRSVIAVDLRGWGETAPAVVEPGKEPTFGVEYKEAFLSLHLGRPLLGQRVWDLMNVIGPGGKGEFELFGVGSAAPVVLHVAAFDERVKAVTIDGGLVSWDNILRTPISRNQLANVVPGVLKEYDLPDLAESLVPRKLTIRNPVDAAGKPLTKEAAEEVYKPVRDAYMKANAADKFALIIEAK